MFQVIFPISRLSRAQRRPCQQLCENGTEHDQSNQRVWQRLQRGCQHESWYPYRDCSLRNCWQKTIQVWRLVQWCYPRKQVRSRMGSNWMDLSILVWWLIAGNNFVFIRMESTGRPGKVHISEKTYQFLKEDYYVEEGDEEEGRILISNFRQYDAPAI